MWTENRGDYYAISEGFAEGAGAWGTLLTVVAKSNPRNLVVRRVLRAYQAARLRAMGQASLTPLGRKALALNPVGNNPLTYTPPAPYGKSMYAIPAQLQYLKVGTVIRGPRGPG
jgi:hypothetical protein